MLTTVCGAARLLGVAPLTIYRYAEQGLLKIAYNRHHAMLVNPDEVRKVMESKRAGRPRKEVNDVN